MYHAYICEEPQLLFHWIPQIITPLLLIVTYTNYYIVIINNSFKYPAIRQKRHFNQNFNIQTPKISTFTLVKKVPRIVDLFIKFHFSPISVLSHLHHIYNPYSLHKYYKHFQSQGF